MPQVIRHLSDALKDILSPDVSTAHANYDIRTFIESEGHHGCLYSHPPLFGCVLVSEMSGATLEVPLGPSAQGQLSSFVYISLCVVYSVLILIVDNLHLGQRQRASPVYSGAPLVTFVVRVARFLASARQQGLPVPMPRDVARYATNRRAISPITLDNLKRLIWGRCFIDDLPLDLMQLVFDQLSYAPEFATFQSLPGSARQQLRFAYLSILRVDHRWYAIILRTPSFWAPLVLGSGSAWTTRALILSRAYPLELRVYNWANIYAHYTQFVCDSVDAIQLALRHTGRIRLLHIEDGFLPPNVIRVVFDVLCSPTVNLSALEELSIIGNAIEPQLPKLSVPSNLFARAIPLRLRKLVVRDSVIPLTCSILQTPLTHLHLTDTTCWLTINEMLCILHGLRSLEELEFDDTNLRLASVVVHTMPASLPLLRKLTFLATSPSILGPVFTYLEVPGSCRHWIEVASDLDAQGDGYSVTHLNKDLRTAFENHILRVCRYEHGDLSDFTMELAHSSNAIEFDDSFMIVLGRYSTDSFTLDMRRATQGDQDLSQMPSAILLGILEWPIVSASVTHFIVSHGVLRSAPWSSILSALPSLQHLTIQLTRDCFVNEPQSDTQSPTIQDLFRVLRDEVTVLPHLLTVTISSAGAWLPFPPALILQVRDALHQRAILASRSPIRLEFHGMFLAERDVQFLVACIGVDVITVED